MCFPPLMPEEVQTWRVNLAGASELLATYAAFLVAEEQARAQRLRAGLVRERFIFGRACLRVLLGHALGVEPHKVPIVAGSDGKPEVRLPTGTGTVSFNVAHSKATVLIALTLGGTVGVDIEHVDRDVSLMEVARHSFSLSEVAKLEAHTDPDQLRGAFFRCWTQKEAVVKADGRGLLLSLSSFEVPVEPARRAPVLVAPGPSHAAAKVYYVTDLHLGDDLAAAVALESPDCCPQLLNFPLEPVV